MSPESLQLFFKGIGHRSALQNDFLSYFSDEILFLHSSV